MRDSHLKVQPQVPPALIPRMSLSLKRKQYNQDDIDCWDKKNKFAKAFIQMNVEIDILPIIAPYSTAHEKWTALVDKFDRKNASTLASLLKGITSVQYNEEDSLTDYFTEFQRLWSSLIEKTSTDASLIKSPKLGWVLHKLSINAEAKSTILLNSLPVN